jgi:hypothetical protein
VVLGSDTCGYKYCRGCRQGGGGEEAVSKAEAGRGGFMREG